MLVAQPMIPTGFASDSIHRRRNRWNEIGQRVFDGICNVCWQEWLKYQQQLINHYGLNLQDAEAKKLLYQNLEKYLFTT